MKKIDVLFVDYHADGFQRYAIDICRNLREERPNIIIAACYMEKADKKEIEGIDYIFCAQEYHLKATAILSEYKPKVLITFAHRFFDYMFTIEAHRKGIIVLNFQHGLYMDSTVISSLSAKSFLQIMQKKKEKFLVYIRCLHNMNGGNMVKTGKLLLKFLKQKSLYHVINSSFGNICHADISFIYGEDWREYYKKQYLETSTEFKVVGYPELEGEMMCVKKENFDEPALPIVCYLVQTSVEDGILDESVMMDFFQKLYDSLENINLVIKLHPRSDRSMYQFFENSQYSGHVLVWNKKPFPIADAYIGHESTVVARALYITGKTLVHRLEPDRVSPFEKYTNFKSGADSDLKIVIKEMLEEDTEHMQNANLGSYVYWNKEQGALKETANEILSMIENS